MDGFLIAAQLFIAVAMYDVWWFRYDKPQRARGGDARTMAEEFRVYGLPDWLRNLVRVLKLTCGTLMIVGVWVPIAAFIGGAGLVILMGGAIAMHVKVSDPLYKFLPATTFFLSAAGSSTHAGP